MNEFNPSAYQRAIFDWVVNGRGDAVVQAVAGAGKTKTLVESAKLIKSNRAIFLAFNKHVATELQHRLGNTMTAKTIHSIGLTTLRQTITKPIVDDGKYGDIGKSYAEEIADDLKRNYSVELRRWSRSKSRDKEKEPEEPLSVGTVLGQLKQLAHYARVTLTNVKDFDAVQEMVDHFGCLDSGLDLKLLHYPLVSMLREGQQIAERQGIIDYDDMLWLPNCWNLESSKSDHVFVDECQDLSAAQLDLVLKMRSRGGRMLFCGDPSQSIFGFAGASSDSVDQIIKRTQATVLPLSICYRCPTSHIKLAQDIVPSIEAAPGAIEGTVEYIPYDKVQSIIAEGDLVISRCTAPVVKLCIELISAKIPARVRGRDIGKSLTAIVKEIAKQPLFDFEKFGYALQAYQYEKILKLQQKKNSESQIESLRDRCSGIWVCYQAFNSHNVLDFCAEIEALFSDSRSSVVLSTVHRCVAPDTLVETPNGLCSISDLNQVGLIATPNGIKNYTQKFNIENGTVIKITTKNGYSITVTPEHGLTSFINGSWQRVNANNLKIGDWLRLKLGATAEVSSEVKLEAPCVSDSRAKQYTFPLTLNEELAELLGLIVADGTIYQKGIRLIKTDRDVVERFKALMFSQFGAIARNVPYGRHGNAYGAEINSVAIAAWLLSIGGMSPNNKLIPSVVLLSPLQVQAAFLRGLFEDAGVNFRHEKVDHICFTNCNPVVTRTVQIMLLRFGIISSTTCRRSQDFHGALYIFGYHAKKFMDCIGFVSERKNSQLRSGLYGEERMYSIPLSKDDASKLLPFLPKSGVKNLSYRGYLSRQALKLALYDYGASLETDLLGWHSDRIVSIELDESKTVCVEVPDGSRFLQNGFDGWNSKGLEERRVFILRPDQLPLTWKNQLPWQKEQEFCLRYVALTRAKEALFFITDEKPIESPSCDEDEDEGSEMDGEDGEYDESEIMF